MTPNLGRPLTWATGMLCAAWLVGVVCAVHVSTWQAPSALMVFGADRVWRGATAGFRAVVRDSGSKVPAARPRVEAWLEGGGISGPKATATGEDAVAWTLPVPELPVDEATLVVRRQGANESEPVVVKVPVKVVDHPESTPLTLLPLHRHAPTVAAHAPGAEVALVPLGGQFAAGLQNPGIGLLLQDRKPRGRTRVRCRSLQLDTHTDDDGLFEFMYTPPLHPEPLHVVLGEDTTPAWVDLVPRVQVPQFQMLVPTRCFAQPAPLPLHVDALPLRRPLAVDLWLDDLLLGVTALPLRQRSADAALSLQAALPSGFLTVVAFRHVLTPQAPSAAFRPMGASVDRMMHELAQRGVQDAWARPDSLSERAAAFLLARVQTGHQATPLLYDDTGAVFEAFEAERHRMRRHIFSVMGGVMGVSLAAIVLGVHRLRRRFKRNVAGVLDEIPEQDRVDDASARHMTEVTDRLWLFLAVLALGLACYGLLTVVTRLQWQ